MSHAAKLHTTILVVILGTTLMGLARPAPQATQAQRIACPGGGYPDSPREYVFIEPTSGSSYTVPNGKTLLVTSLFISPPPPGFSITTNVAGIYVDRPGQFLRQYFFRKSSQLAKIPMVVVESGQSLSSSTGAVSGVLVDNVTVVDGVKTNYVAIDELEMPYTVPSGYSLVITAIGADFDQKHELWLNGALRGQVVTGTETVVDVGGVVVPAGSTVEVKTPGAVPFINGGPAPIIFGFLAQS